MTETQIINRLCNLIWSIMNCLEVSMERLTQPSYQKYLYSPTRIVFKLFSHVETATILNKPHERTDKQIKLPVPHDAGMENCMNIAIQAACVVCKCRNSVYNNNNNNNCVQIRI